MKKYLLIILSLCAALGSYAQTDGPLSLFSGLEYEVNAGVNIGGTSPIPLPAEIRKIDSYSPNLNLQVGTTVTKWLGVDHRWGVAVTLRLGTKGMETGAQVKNYGMEIYQDGKKLAGRWTGRVHTKYHSQQLEIPVTAVYRVNRRFKVNAGAYVAYAFNNGFDGYVEEGYLRVGDPTGDKVVFEDGSRATYDFGENLRRFQWGLQAGVSWVAYKHLLVNANLTWGLNGAFESSFKTISFGMYPIYLNAGFGYVF
ncbi:MAG: PorT family protein [Duncaniella sp.]|nr:PorT family protein [Duncaniella sp.]MDE5752558.1 PorT family protein [Duncaniella sp.]MDE5918717.1 PorT family protein [Duncaniella sp.]MDE6327462.1 PorT family protein [Duncaniella sp.]MDE6465115.1 PorT family protein [Duncaniella sp.]